MPATLRAEFGERMNGRDAMAITKSRRKRPEVDLRTHPDGAIAAQIETQHGSVVALGNLRVLITKEDGTWIAQGLEIDYAIDGESLKDVKQRFMMGLSMTVESHLRVYNSIDNLLKVAPPEVWAEYFAERNTLRRFEHSQVTAVSKLQQNLQRILPFENIEFYEKTEQVA
jgi:hypothetical protein